MSGFRGRVPIAIIGAAHRLPGPDGVPLNSAELWQALLDKRDLVSQVDPTRWSQQSLLHPRRSEPGTAVTFAAGSIGDVAGFDAAFFGISPREAGQMDPQQRLLLELVWEAFEDGGVVATQARGRQWGVFVGLSSVDYSYRRVDDMGSFDSSTMTGNAGSIAANRISFVYDLRGPSMMIDTACSSSLVAMHQACLSIHAGESEAAVVAGVSIHAHPHPFVGFSKASMLSAGGRCKPWDAAGDGYVRSEGAAVVLLKPLDRAIADGDNILALVPASGVNADGHKHGLTVPSHTAQADLLRRIYADAGIQPADLDYLEAHGTGTSVGDPLETRAIAEALGMHRSKDNPLPIGSVKSNVGHLESAAGMAGLIKALMTIRHRRVPATINLKTLNPNIPFKDWNLKPVLETLPLPADKPLLVGVNSFGFGGANAHVVLASYQAPAPVESATPTTAAAVPLVLSARSDAARRALARSIAQLLRGNPSASVYDIAYAATFRRDPGSHRLLVWADNRDTLADTLDTFAADANAQGVQTGSLLAGASAPAFIYTGNGSQWAGMGRHLLETNATFRAAIEEVDALYVKRVGSTDASIVAELRASDGASRLEFTEVAQPTLFAIQVGLTRLLAEQGVRPAAVSGHSVGEVASAWASGALSLEQAVAVIHERSFQQGRTKGTGAMTAVAMPVQELEALIASLGLTNTVAIAGINSPGGCTVAGAVAGLAQLEAGLAERRARFKRLGLDYAFHSPAMEPVRDDLIKALDGLHPSAASVPFYSSVTGNLLSGDQLGAEYWWTNIREPVRFHGAIDAMIDAGVRVFVEIGPEPILRGYLGECLKAAAQRHEGLHGLTLSTLQRSDPLADPAVRVRDQLLLAGAKIHVQTWFPRVGQWVDMPLYPWQRERHWHPVTSESLGLLNRVVVHPLLGYAVAGAQTTWENHLDTHLYPWLGDHQVAGTAVFPAAGYVEMALAAGQQIEPDLTHSLEDLEIVAPMMLKHDGSRTVRFQLDPTDQRFSISSRERLSEDNWVLHANGRLVTLSERPVPAAWQTPAQPADAMAAAHYALADQLGLHYGPAFQVVTDVWLNRTSVQARLATPELIRADVAKTLLHPSHFDGALQLLADLLLAEALPQRQAGISVTAQQLAEASAVLRESPAFLPVRIERLNLLAPGKAVGAASATLLRRGPRSLVADFTLYDTEGNAIAQAYRVRFRAAPRKRAGANRAAVLHAQAVPMPRSSVGQALSGVALNALTLACAEALHAEPRAQHRQRFVTEVEPLLDMLCVSFAERALKQLAGDASHIDAAQWMSSGRIAPGAGSMFLRLLGLLSDHGVLEPAEGMRWLWSDAEPLPAPEEIWSSLVYDYPEYAALIGRVGSAGLRLQERLGGAALGAVSRSAGFSSGIWTSGCTIGDVAGLIDGLIQLIRRAVDGLQAGARLRVLSMLPAVAIDHFVRVAPQQIDLSRCDLNLGAHEAEAADLLGALLREHPTLTASDIRFDEDNASLSQHPLAGTFDLIILADGVALAPQPELRLDLARDLLADQGVLAVVEQHPSGALDFLHGFDPAWWEPARDLASGARARLYNPTHCQAVLEQFGYTDIQAVFDLATETDSQSEALAGPDAGPYVMLARRPARGSAAAEQEQALPRHWIVLHDSEGFSADLATHLLGSLAHLGQTLTHVHPAAAFAVQGSTYQINPGQADDWLKVFQGLRASGIEPQGLLHLQGLEPQSAGMTAEQRLAIQENRAASLIAWLRAGQVAALATDVCVVTAHVHVPMLPANVQERVKGVDVLRDAAVLGAVRVAVNEYPQQRIRLIDLIDPVADADNAANLAQEIVFPDADDEVILAREGRFVPRYADYQRQRASLPGQATQAGVRLEVPMSASLRGLTWRPVEDREPAPGEVEIEVCAAGLNFRDVMYSMGLLPDEALENGFSGPTLGMELSGIVRRIGAGVTELKPGQDVLAFAPASFATRVYTRADAVVPKPQGWSHEAGATVPTAFFTAWYALHELARIEPGEKVLIHGAAGGVGIAAIQIARHLGAEVYATAGSTEKRDFVRLLGASRVFDSRSLSFADDLLQASGGEGVDVILNSVAGEAVRRNLAILKPFGRMLELGKRDFYENTRIGLRPFRNNVSYFGIDADQLMVERPRMARRVLLEMLALFESDALRPLPHVAFDASEIESAFAWMRDSRQTGKIVVRFNPAFAPTESRLPPAQAISLSADATYLVTGGLSGFGLRTAQWLADRGARHLALMSRRGAASPGVSASLEQLRASGVSVQAIACDVANPLALKKALAEIAATMPPLRGVIHGAMVMQDALIRNSDQASLHQVLAPKAAGAVHLDQLTRHLSLDFFLMYSSVTTVIGNPGQVKYVAANAVLEALAYERRAAGLAGDCVLWGPIADAGYLADNEGVRDVLAAHLGAPPLPAAEALSWLDRVLGGTLPPNPALLDADWGTMAKHMHAVTAPRFAQLVRGSRKENTGAQTSADVREWLLSLNGEEFDRALADILTQEIGAILRIAPERISHTDSLFDIGMDSLMALELATAIDGRIGTRLPDSILSEAPTVERLAQRLARMLRPAASDDDIAGEAASDGLAEVRALMARHGGDMSEEDMSRLAANKSTGGSKS